MSNVADEPQLPPPVEDSEARIKERDHDASFARLPEDETHPVTRPGEGPSGPVASTNGPVVLMAVGAVIAFLVFVFQSPWVLILGIAIFLGAAVWAGVVNRGPGSMSGVGPSTRKRDDH